MKKLLKKVLCLSMVALVAVFAVGCGDSGNSSPNSKSESQGESVSETSDNVAKVEDYDTTTIEEGKTVSISVCNNADATIYDIPSEINGEKVIAIDNRAFASHQKVEEVIVPSTVKKIGELSMAICSNLKKATLNEGVEEIGMKCFSQDTSLVEVSLPSTLKTISAYAFLYCPELEKITIPDGVETIEDGAFSRCEKLKEVHILNSSTYIQTLSKDNIEASVFEDSPNVTIYAPKGSYAEKYAKQENIKFVAE